MYPEVDMIIIKGGIQEVQVGLPRKCLNKSQKSHVQTYSFLQTVRVQLRTLFVIILINI